MKIRNISYDRPLAVIKGRVSPKRAGTPGVTFLDTVGDDVTAPDVQFVGATVSGEDGELAIVTINGSGQQATNNSGSALEYGDVVILDTDGTLTTTTIAQDTRPVGVVQVGGADGDPVHALFSGYVAQANTTGTVLEGDYLETSTTAGRAQANSARRAGSFALALADGPNPPALMFGIPDTTGVGGSAAGAIAGVADTNGVNDAVVVGGSLSTVTSATAAFTAADTGKRYTLATTAGTITRGTLTYVSATSCTMSTAAGGAMTGARLIWGTDNLAAVQAALDAASPGDRVDFGTPGRYFVYGNIDIPEGVAFGPVGKGPFFPDTAIYANTWGTTLVIDHGTTDHAITLNQGSGVDDFIMFDAGQVPPTADTPVSRAPFIGVAEDTEAWADRQTRVSGWHIGSPYLCNPYTGLYLRGGGGTVGKPQIGGLYRSVIIDHNYDFISIERIKVDRLACISEAPALGSAGLNTWYIENPVALAIYRADGFRIHELSTFAIYGGIEMVDSPDGPQDPGAYECGYGMIDILDIDSCIRGVYVTATNSPGLIIGEFQCGPNALYGTAGARAVHLDTGGSLAPLVIIGSWAVRGSWSVAVTDEDAGTLIVPGTNPGTGAASAEGAVAIRYIFSTTTTNSDPGAGVLRLSNSTQSLSTTVRADLLDANGADVTTVLDVIGDQTGTTKGYLRLQSSRDPRRWLLFDATALASPSGYRNITVSVRSGSPNSVTSPLVNGEPITLIFTPSTVGISGGSGSVATDTIFDAAGDLVQGTGADAAAKLSAGTAGKILTAAGSSAAVAWGQGPLSTTGDLMIGASGGTPTRLAKGAAGANLSTYNGVVAWNGGTSFPASPGGGERYWRSDYGIEFVYDGTRWLCTCPHERPLGISDGLLPLAATSGGAFRSTNPWNGTFAIYVQQTIVSFEVAGGTALSASHKWVGTIADDGGTYATITIDSGASNTQRVDNQSINSVRAITSKRILSGWTKTGTPGSLYVYPTIIYRLIAT